MVSVAARDRDGRDAIGVARDCSQLALIWAVSEL